MDYTVYRHKTLALVEATRIAYIDCPYSHLVELFGAPLDGDGKDRDVEWQILLPNLHPVAIYNYRSGKAYMGRDGEEVENLTAWQIDGHYESDAEMLKEFIEGKTYYEFDAHLQGRTPEDIIKRLKGIVDHMEQGSTESLKASDYHSWKLEKHKDSVYPQV